MNHVDEATPEAVVDLERVRSGVRLVGRAAPGARVCYAVKASYYPSILAAVLASRGGLAVCSELELELALASGALPEAIQFNGVMRRPAAIARAMRMGVHVILESIPEVRALIGWRDEHAERAPGHVGLRLRPLSAYGKYVTFGMDHDAALKAVELLDASGLRVDSVSFHCVASQLDARGHLEALDALDDTISQLREHVGCRLEHINVGGGIASRQAVGDDRASSLFAEIADACRVRHDLPALFELGRFLVADTETMRTTVLDVRGVEEQVVVVDVSTNYLIPAPGHEYVALTSNGSETIQTIVIDRMGSEICRQPAPPLRAGQVIEIANCGAYAGVMRENFVYPLPSVRFTGATERVAIRRPDIATAMAVHGWSDALHPLSSSGAEQ